MGVKIKHLVLLVIVFAGVVLAPESLLAQDDDAETPEPRVQVFEGYVYDGEWLYYVLPDLRQGDVLFARMSNTSGNLDPVLLLSRPGAVTPELLQNMRDELAVRVAAGEDRSLATQSIVLTNFLAGNADYGGSSAAALAYEIPADGDYLLLALDALLNETEGGYRLVVGLDAPAVLEGQSRQTGEEIAFLDHELSGIYAAVQEIWGELTAEQQGWFYNIPQLEPGDTLYAYVETTTGGLRPILSLEDYSGRVLRDANTTGQQSQAMFEYKVSDFTENFRLRVDAWSAEGEEVGEGEYRLLVGVNEPAILSGEAQPFGRAVVATSVPVTIFVELQQITGVDQKAENYGGVYYIQMDWHDPTQAFNPDECRCRFKTFVGPGFNKLVSDENFIWPTFTIFNQQNNRWTQNQGIIIAANGDMRYFERFTTTFQAPDFNFRAFPFDTQQFYMRIDALYPKNFFEFDGPPELSMVGDQLGEEEWQLTEYTTEVSDVPGLGEVSSSRFSFGFKAHRHLNFYIMRIFLPTLLIIIVSYFTFFLKDYSKRIDVTSANLLVFVAFNFTISGDLPRLGYLTFMDAMLASVFAVTALVVAFNVYLKRLELTGREDRARKIDSYTLWVYPALYLIGGTVLTIYFLLPEYWGQIMGAMS